LIFVLRIGLLVLVGFSGCGGWATGLMIVFLFIKAIIIIWFFSFGLGVLFAIEPMLAMLCLTWFIFSLSIL